MKAVAREVYRLADVRFSNDRRYRYYLRAEIVKPSGQLRLVVFQLNPSKAGIDRSDATVGKVCNWAARNGFCAVLFLNLFSFIETAPTKISREVQYAELVGSETDVFIDSVLRQTKPSHVVFGYGEPEGVLQQHLLTRVSEVESLVKRVGVLRIWRVGKLTHGGFPRHGRAWNKNTELELLNEFERN